MKAASDPQLLHDYVERRSEAAFAELVRRHIDLVHSVACRLVNDPHRAKDVSQGVFVALAKNARLLADHPTLSGWLYRTTRNIASQAVRTEMRRRDREQQAAMNSFPESDDSWEEISPHLDAVLDELSASDRDAVLLRYFENRPAREMAAIIGTSVEAAQKRVNRAVERLREKLARRGITAGAAGLAGVISANAVQVAPVGLAADLSVAALAVTTIRLLGMTMLQKSLIGITIAALAGVGIYVAAGKAETLGRADRSRELPAATKTKNPRPNQGRPREEEKQWALSKKSPAGREDIARMSWPDVVGNFPPITGNFPGDEVPIFFGRYVVTRRQPAELRGLGGSGGPMIEIEVRDTESPWSAVFTTQSVNGRLLGDHEGRPQIENWGRGGGGYWTRQLFQYVSGEYKHVRTDEFQEVIRPGMENNPVTEPPFLPHGEGDDRGRTLYFTETRIPKP